MIPSLISEARKGFHEAILRSVLRTDVDGVPSNADKSNRLSVAVAQGVAERLGTRSVGDRLAGQMSGSKFEELCAEFLEKTFLQLVHLRPGTWRIQRASGRNRLEIAKYEQYSHLVALDDAAKKDPVLAAALGSDYTIVPDIIISREPELDETINLPRLVVDEEIARLTSLRKLNNSLQILHASVSCKWTIRSDRAQNARSEALNLIRNRKGRLPHIVVVTAEPLPSRLASIALGTGDIDCVYHFALPELEDTIKEHKAPDAQDMLDILVCGQRLRDISDLPLDLAI